MTRRKKKRGFLKTPWSKKRYTNRWKKLKDSRKSVHSYSFFILFLTYLLISVGLIFLFDGSIFRAVENHDKYFFIKKQLQWIGIGSIALFVFSKINYKVYLGKNSIVILAGVVLSLISLLVLPKILPEGLRDYFFPIRGGAVRWITIGGESGITIQPSEFAKIGMILYLSSWLAEQKYTYKSVKEAIKFHFMYGLVGFILIVGLVGVLILLQPDMGTTIVIVVIAFIIYFVSGNDVVHLGGSVALVIVFVVLMVVAGVVAPYRFKRIMVFKDVFLTGHVAYEDRFEDGQQMEHILTGIGSGSWFGKGLGNSIQQHGYLVENTAFTDSIIAVYFEETGFVGAIVIILVYIFYMYLCFLVAQKTEDKAGKLIAIGIGSLISIQAFLHIATNTAVIPLTGLPLPFFTYGGSSTLSTMIGVGILLNIDKRG